VLIPSRAHPERYEGKVIKDFPSVGSLLSQRSNHEK
jgi:hypothetical protein